MLDNRLDCDRVNGTSVTHHRSADKCPFCGAAIVAEAASSKIIKPRSLLPFHIRPEQATELFRQWISGLWFAPSELRKFAEAGSLKGVYIPYWTYDSDTDSYGHCGPHDTRNCQAPAELDRCAEVHLG